MHPLTEGQSRITHDAVVGISAADCQLRFSATRDAHPPPSVDSVGYVAVDDYLGVIRTDAAGEGSRIDPRRDAEISTDQVVIAAILLPVVAVAVKRQASSQLPNSERGTTVQRTGATAAAGIVEPGADALVHRPVQQQTAGHGMARLDDAAGNGFGEYAAHAINSRPSD
jgi:hypothetical protein